MNNPTDDRSQTAALCTIALALTVTVLLTQVGLAAPPVTGFSAFRSFVALHGAVPSALGMLRVLAIFGTSYVLAIGTLAFVASLGSPSATFCRAMRAVTLPPLRHLIPGLLGTGFALLPVIQAPMVASAAAPAAPSTTTHSYVASNAAAPSRPKLETDVMVRLPSPSQSTSTTAVGESNEGNGTASIVLIGPDGKAQPTPTNPSAESEVPTSHTKDSTSRSAPTSVPPTTKRVWRFPLASPAVAVSPPPTGSTRSNGSGNTQAAHTGGNDKADVHTSPQVPGADHSGVDTTWTVTPGDHLWHIAAVTVSRALRHGATDAQITDYWQNLIAANQARLIDPANPDLILPGQVLLLPSVSVPSD